MSARKFFFGLLAGISAGILFAPESGKKLRERLGKSEAKMSDFAKALCETGKDANTEVQKILETKEIQKWLKEGKQSLLELGDMVEKKSKNLSKTAQKELNNVLQTALDKAENAKKSVKKTVKKTVKKATKTIQKKIK